MRPTMILAATLATALAAPALAGQPGWAPAHGWRDARYGDRFDDRRFDRRAYARGFDDALDNRRYRVRGDARSYEAGYRDGLRQARYDNRRRHQACHYRDQGTGGLVAGAALGGVLGSQIARNDRTAGAIVGAVTGGLLGRAIDRNDGRC